MEQPHLFTLGDLVPFEHLTSNMARELARFLDAELNPFARLEECRVTTRNGEVLHEVVVVEVDVEVPQHPAYDIRHCEQLAVTFSPGDELQPEVLALRTDFPPAPHLNLRPSGFLPSLCLYDRPFDEVLIDWTAPSFLERIREWLAQTAKGQLHGDDQPLEPLLFGPMEDLVVPGDIYAAISGVAPKWLSIRLVLRDSGLVKAIPRRLDGTDLADGIDCSALVISCPPQTHGVINHMPSTLRELHNFVAGSGLNLLGILREELKKRLLSSEEDFQRGLGTPMILIIRLPKTREPGGDVEVVEVRPFMLLTNVQEVGADIGVWGVSEDKPGLLLCLDEAKRGEATSVIPLNPRPEFSPSLAAWVNGFEDSICMSVTAIGVGALGSQVVSNLVRAGFGQWTLIDGDVFLPHNLGRHALDGSALGSPKAVAVAEVLNRITEDASKAHAIVANVLRPGESTEQVLAALAEAEVILDMSASIPAARHLCRDVNADGRRISLFLNPSGTALTLLAEDKERRIPLDILEMQFYREIVGNSELGGLLEPVDRRRTGQSCRDVSAQIPQDLVALHAAVASHAVREALGSDLAQISIWRVKQQGFTMSATSVSPAQPTKKRVGDWTVYTDSRLQERLAGLRQARLPTETGGVLIGAYDMHRKIIYIVDTVPSPEDSEEWLTGYIRGSKGLQQQVADICKVTEGMLRYIGEWHSHPDGTSVTPSANDRELLAWIGKNAKLDGVPGVMAIVGDRKRPTLHLADATATSRG